MTTSLEIYLRQLSVKARVQKDFYDTTTTLTSIISTTSRYACDAHLAIQFSTKQTSSTVISFVANIESKIFTPEMF